MKDKKLELRATASVRRESFSPSDLALWNRAIQETALRFGPYLIAQSVALYSPVRNEVATERIRDHALRAGKKVFYPKLSRGYGLALVRVESATEFGPGRHGILEPFGDTLLGEQEREELVVFVPGLAFDLRGNRLGRGGGWYDRVLEILGKGPLFVGLAYEFQVVRELPAETWDQRVHTIITERRVVNCRDIPAQ